MRHFSDGPDAVYLNQRSPMKGEEGDNVVVSCDAKCVPSCSYRWRFKYRTKSISANLTLTNIQKADAGVYTCTAVNGLKGSVSAYTSFTLEMRCK